MYEVRDAAAFVKKSAPGVEQGGIVGQWPGNRDRAFAGRTRDVFVNDAGNEGSRPGSVPDRFGNVIAW